jgi:hypothetical protein
MPAKVSEESDGNTEGSRRWSAPPVLQQKKTEEMPETPFQNKP